MTATGSPLRVATPSGTGQQTQPCANCPGTVAAREVTVRNTGGARVRQWRHADGSRPCPPKEDS